MFNAQSAHNEIIVVQLTHHAKRIIVSGSPASLLYGDIHAMESHAQEYPCQFFTT